MAVYVQDDPVSLNDPLGLMGFGGGGGSGGTPRTGGGTPTPPPTQQAACIKKCDAFESKCAFAAWTGGITAEMLLCTAACTLASGGVASPVCLLACAALGGLERPHYLPNVRRLAMRVENSVTANE